MLRLLINLAISLIAAAIGLLIAAIVLPDMSIDAISFVVDVAIFALIRAILAPFIIKTTVRKARPLLGAAGLFASLAALIITALISNGLQIRGFNTWVFATLIVWFASMLAAFLLPLLILKGLLGVRLCNVLGPDVGRDHLGRLAAGDFGS